MRFIVVAAIAAMSTSGAAYAGDADKCFDKGTLSYVDCPQPAPAVAAPPPAPVPVIPPAPSWTGFYLGASLGARWMEADWTTTANRDTNGDPLPIDETEASFSDAALRFGALAGYDHQISPRFVLGIEADAGYADNEDQILDLPGIGLSASNLSTVDLDADWDAGVRARLGYLATPELMLFASGGVSFLGVEAKSFCPSDDQVCNAVDPAQGLSEEETLIGWSLGAGAEYLLNEDWSLRAEYRYTDYGTYDFTAFNPIPTTVVGGEADIDVTTHTGMVAVSYRF